MTCLQTGDMGTTTIQRWTNVIDAGPASGLRGESQKSQSQVYALNCLAQTVVIVSTIVHQTTI